MENKAQPEADAEGTMFDNFMSIFQRRNSTPRSPVSADPLNSIPFLSPIANSVVSRSSKILNTPSDELRSSFDTDTVETDHQSITYARNFVEFCSYRALNETASPGKTQGEDEDGWSLFYSSSTDMAVQVDNENTVGLEAFARIAPACAVIADVATVQNLFDALTNTSGNRLHFLLYDKYLQSLDRVIKSAKNVLSASSNLKLADEEIIVDVDGTVPTQPILQHIGISAWPGRLTLSSKALYFESLGVGQYDKPAQYDLSRDLKQVIKPELTGPLGARLFDKAVMYRSISLAEPIFLEFPEFKGSSRRDYWLDVTLEILLAHRFVRKYHLKGIQESEAIARAILGIFRCRAVREGFHIFSSHYKTLLVFNLAENLPGGDTILETLSSCLALLEASTAQADSSGSVCTEKRHTVSPVSLLALKRFGLVPHDNVEFDEEGIYSSGYVSVGEADPLEVAVKQSKVGTGKAEAAQETVNQVKVDGIDANIAIMK
ncbi:Haloacid dehalogenase-like hydrolase domain-containing protein 3, partial [Bienertia sinuspersici]